MEDKIKNIYKNKVIEKFTQVPIEFKDKYMIPNEMELEIMREIWKEAQKEILEEIYDFITHSDYINNDDKMEGLYELIKEKLVSLDTNNTSKEN